MQRCGVGYDSHRFAKGRKLIIGGVTIDYEYGLLGHSDADVLIHAIIDSLLGAAGLSDIGTYFPDTDENYKDVSSLKLLEKTKELLRKEDSTIINIDNIIIAQEPKMRPYIDEMKKNISKALCIDEKKISIKSKTNEGMGFVGKKQGIVSLSVSSVDCKKIF